MQFKKKDPLCLLRIPLLMLSKCGYSAYFLFFEEYTKMKKTHIWHHLPELYTGIITLVSVSIFLVLSPYGNAANSPPEKAPSPLFVRSLCIGPAGNLVSACEKEGLFVQDGTEWKPLPPVRFAGEPAISLVLGSDGTLWAGLRRGGVVRLRTEGPGKPYRSQRIVPLAGIGWTYARSVVCVSDTVWIVTENGVARWSQKGGWSRFPSVVGGFPECPADIVAMPDGTMRAAGRNGGMASLRKETWTETLVDQGMRGIQINDLLADPKGNLWVAAQEGLFRQNPAGEWLHFSPEKDKVSPEDALLCLAIGPDGRILCGSRRSGLFSFAPDARQWQALPKGDNGPPDNFVSAILVLPDGGVAVGTYGYGVRILRSPAWKPAVPAVARPMNPVPVAAGETVRYLGEDRDSRGDWMGAYGRAAWVLAAMGRPYDYTGGSQGGDFGCRPYMGPNHRVGDSLRHWVHWLKTEDPRSLQCPADAGRRQASWDDAGELYAPAHDGPDLLVDLDIPPGVWQLSLYFVNIDALDCPAYWRTSDGLPFPNRFRDYRVQVMRREEEKKEGGVLASCRVTDFCDGVYQKFSIEGGAYTLRVLRGRSHNTVLAGVFFDPAPPAAPVAGTIERGMAAFSALRAGRRLPETEAVATALELHACGHPGMAADLLAAAGTGWEKALAAAPAPERAKLATACITDCLDVYERLHVAGHEQFLARGHDPDAGAELFLLPALRALDAGEEGHRLPLALVQKARQRPGCTGLCRIALPYLPAGILPELRAEIAAKLGDGHAEADLWLRHAQSALCPGDSLSRALLASLRMGDLKTARQTLARLEALPEDGYREHYVRNAREVLAAVAKTKENQP